MLQLNALDLNSVNLFCGDVLLHYLLAELLKRANYEIKISKEYFHTRELYELPGFLFMDEDYLRYNDGKELLKLHAADFRARYVVKFLFAKELTVLDGLKMGFEEVFELPFNTEILLETLEKWRKYLLKIKEFAIPAPFKFGPFIFDDRIYDVFYKGEPLGLTWTQYLIFKAIALRADWWTTHEIAADLRVSEWYVVTTLSAIERKTGNFYDLFLEKGGKYRAKVKPVQLTEAEFDNFMRRS